MKNLDKCWVVLYIETRHIPDSDDVIKEFMTMEFKKKKEAMNFVKELRENIDYRVIGVFKSFYIADF